MLNSGESKATTETSGQPGRSDWTEIDIISIIISIDVSDDILSIDIIICNNLKWKAQPTKRRLFVKKQKLQKIPTYDGNTRSCSNSISDAACGCHNVPGCAHVALSDER